MTKEKRRYVAETNKKKEAAKYVDGEGLIIHQSKTGSATNTFSKTPQCVLLVPSRGRIFSPAHNSKFFFANLFILNCEGLFFFLSFFAVVGDLSLVGDYLTNAIPPRATYGSLLATRKLGNVIS